MYNKRAETFSSFSDTSQYIGNFVLGSFDRKFSALQNYRLRFSSKFFLSTKFKRLTPSPSSNCDFRSPAGICRFVFSVSTIFLRFLVLSFSRKRLWTNTYEYSQECPRFFVLPKMSPWWNVHRTKCPSGNGLRNLVLLRNVLYDQNFLSVKNKGCLMNMLIMKFI